MAPMNITLICGKKCLKKHLFSATIASKSVPFQGFHFGGVHIKFTQFAAFWNIFCCNFVKKIFKMFIFCIKIIDIVLLCTIFRGIGAYSPECLFIVQIGPYISLLRKYI